MPAIHVFIISWRGQHERAAAIARSVATSADKLSIVYSDPSGQPQSLEGLPVIERDNRLFWADKFQACLEQCAPEDIMLIIHADCLCEDWQRMVTRCKAAFAHFAELGIWTPRIIGTPWRLERTRMQRIAGSDYSIVAHTDGLVFALNPALYPRMKRADYSGNVYGLGIDWLFLCAAYARGMTAITDEAITVRHPISRGYSSANARKQKRAFLNQMTAEEQLVYSRLRVHLRKRHIYHKLHWFAFQRWSRQEATLAP